MVTSFDREQQLGPEGTVGESSSDSNPQQHSAVLEARTVSMCLSDAPRPSASGEQNEAPKPAKKKSLVKKIFNKTKKDKTKANKENIELNEKPDQECPFKRFERRSRSFGAQGSYRVMGNSHENARYGSCRMTKPVLKFKADKNGSIPSLEDSYSTAVEHNRNNSMRQRVSQCQQGSSQFNSTLHKLSVQDSLARVSLCSRANTCSDVGDSSLVSRENILGNNNPVGGGKGDNRPGSKISSPLKNGVVETLPRQQIEKMIKQMQDDHQ